MAKTEGPSSSVAAMTVAPGDSPLAGCLLASLTQGGAAAWDPRAPGAPAARFAPHRGGRGTLAAPGKGAVGGGGPIVAVGEGDCIVAYDARGAAGGAGGAAPLRPLASFPDTHAEAVTAITVAPGQKIVAGSEDGFLSAIDLSLTLDEEDAYVASLSAGAAVAGVTLYGGPDLPRALVTTGNETALTWDWRAMAQDEGGRDGAGARAESALARRELQALWRGPGEAGSGAADARDPTLGLDFMDEWTEGGVEYLVGGSYDPVSGALTLLAGTNEGDLAAFPVDGGALKPAPLFGPPLAVLAGGHADVVRAFLPLAGGTAAVTGGEDGRVVLWAPGSAAAGEGRDAARPPASRGGGGGGGVRRREPKSSKRSTPY